MLSAILQDAAGGTLWDFTNYVRIPESVDPYPVYEEPSFGDSPFAEGQPLGGVDARNREMSFPVYVKDTTGKDALHTLVQTAVRACRSAKRLRWQDDGATNPTFYDVTYARFDATGYADPFGYRKAQKGYIAGYVRIYCAPPYGHTGTFRTVASVLASGAAVQVSTPSLAGDVDGLLDLNVITGSAPGDGRFIAAAPLPSGYQMYFPAGSMTAPNQAAASTSSWPAAAIVGQPAAQGSQAWQVFIPALQRVDQGFQSDVEALRLAVAVGSGAYNGRNRVFAFVKVPGPPVFVTAQDLAGAPIGGTAVASTCLPSGGMQLLDLGVLDVRGQQGTFGVILRTGAVQQGSAQFTQGGGQLSYPSGTADLQVGGVAFLPERDSLQYLVDLDRRLLSVHTEHERWGELATSILTGRYDRLGGVWATGVASFATGSFVASPLVAWYGNTPPYLQSGTGVNSAANALLLAGGPRRDFRVEVTAMSVHATAGGIGPVYELTKLLPTFRSAHLNYSPRLRWGQTSGGSGFLSIHQLNTLIASAALPSAMASPAMFHSTYEAVFQGPVVRLRMIDAFGSIVASIGASRGDWMGPGNPHLGYFSASVSMTAAARIVNMRVWAQASRTQNPREYVNLTPTVAWRGTGSNAWVEDLPGAKVGARISPTAAAVGVIAMPLPGGLASDVLNVQVRVQERFAVVR